ncbi:hypothetical protein SAMD00079811_76350 (plasmid) [Scytonema sp. HK-05]|jgi:hypothetical protein|uniref:hypothetical protein n=1 Tax=Scytonema sp. HK-05 TaxID=1137095 RepID=UPI000A73DFFE|nr:hypothetical protein [Scytonema sp. HK-05]BAY50006.1 hypothetical protein SAMD00079811_76350 [Scytonema sp. HK-05]
MEGILRFFENLLNSVIYHITSLISGLINSVMYTAEQKARDSINKQLQKRQKDEEED